MSQIVKNHYISNTKIMLINIIILLIPCFLIWRICSNLSENLSVGIGTFFLISIIIIDPILVVISFVASLFVKLILLFFDEDPRQSNLFTVVFQALVFIFTMNTGMLYFNVTAKELNPLVFIALNSIIFGLALYMLHTLMVNRCKVSYKNSVYTSAFLFVFYIGINVIGVMI